MPGLLPGFFERYGDRIAPEHRELCDRLAAGLDRCLADRPRPFAIQHAGYRPGNLLFGRRGSRNPLTMAGDVTSSS